MFKYGNIDGGNKLLTVVFAGDQEIIANYESDITFEIIRRISKMSTPLSRNDLRLPTGINFFFLKMRKSNVFQHNKVKRNII